MTDGMSRDLHQIPEICFLDERLTWNERVDDVRRSGGLCFKDCDLSLLSVQMFRFPPSFHPAGEVAFFFSSSTPSPQPPSQLFAVIKVTHTLSCPRMELRFMMHFVACELESSSESTPSRRSPQEPQQEEPPRNATSDCPSQWPAIVLTLDLKVGVNRDDHGVDRSRARGGKVVGDGVATRALCVNFLRD